MASPPNILTVDLEDWYQSTLDFDLPITPRVVDNTSRLLDVFAAAGVRATFFVLGLVAEKYPDLVRRVARAGHEVACHGRDHRPVHAMSPEAFRADLRRAVAAVEGASGERVRGYRAPDFSIDARSLWALRVIAEEGLSYDSSVFPIAGPRYGVRDAFPDPYRVACPGGREILELPLATVELLGVRLPVAGGGYFRLLPYAITRAAVARMNRSGRAAMSYFHPYEVDTEEIAAAPRPVPMKVRLSQGIGRGGVAAKISRLLSEFTWSPVRDRLPEAGALAGDRLLDLTDLEGAGARWTTVR